MRPRIVFPVLFFAVVFVTALISFRSRQTLPPTAQNDGDTPSPAAVSSPSKVRANENLRSVSGPEAAVVITTPAPVAELSEEERAGQDQIVSERISELNELAASDDKNSLRQILAELDNPEARIREAAVQAAVQFKSAEAIPALRESLERATDLDEKVAIRDAIEFLTPDVASVNP